MQHDTSKRLQLIYLHMVKLGSPMIVKINPHNIFAVLFLGNIALISKVWLFCLVFSSFDGLLRLIACDVLAWDLKKN